jgi:DNA-binding CsgD family transcriptional regulator
MPSYKEQYYTLQEEEIQALISKAKTGSDKYQAEILNVFDNFLKKYVSLIFLGKYNLNDYDIRRFVSLFIKDPSLRFRVMKNQMNGSTARGVQEVMSGIQYMVKRYCSEEDVRQTVDMTFFQCIQRYERKGPIPFSGFLYSYFFYLLKKNVDVFLIDQLGRKTFMLLGDDEELDDDNKGVIGFKADPVLISMEQMLSVDEINSYWVLGQNVMPPFDQLSIQERQLLKWKYVDGKKSSEISDKINEHPNTVREHIVKIRSKIRDYIKDNAIEEYSFLINMENK